LTAIFETGNSLTAAQVDRRALDMVHAVLSARDAPVGVTPRELVWRKNKAHLYRYQRQSPPRHRTPVFLVLPLINRAYILDLRPGASFVEHLLQEGFDVFLLDWGIPGDEDRALDIATLLTRYLPRATRKASDAAGHVPLTVLGYCIGGTLAACYTALYPKTPVEVRNLVLFTTPIDFSDAGKFGALTRRGVFPIEQLTSTLPLVPGQMPDMGAKLLSPLPTTIGTYMRLWDRLGDNGFDIGAWQAMYRWVNEGVPFPSAAYRQWIVEFYQENRLVRGRLEIGGRIVRLNNIRCPLLNVAASGDEIAPRSTTRAIINKVSSTDAQEIVLQGGHVGIVVGRAAKNGLWPRVTEWLAHHD
jgi:polyhydroxyalkanoate synthase subunit PhaC